MLSGQVRSCVGEAHEDEAAAGDHNDDGPAGGDARRRKLTEFIFQSY
jgi:hypothetical protein